MFCLILVRRQAGKINVINLAKPVRDDADHILLIFCHHCHNIEVDSRRHYHAVIMVGVIAANLGAAGRRVQAYRAAGSKIYFKILNQFQIPLTLCCDYRSIIGIQFGKRPVISTVPNTLFEFCAGSHDSFHLSIFVGYAQKRHVVFGETSLLSKISRCSVPSIPNSAQM